jgi:hypothetical protein
VAACAPASILVSTNHGVSWTAPLLDLPTPHLWGITSAGGLLAAGGSAGVLLTSVEQAPSVPVPSLPAHNTVGVSFTPDLHWNASARAISYRVQLSLDSTFASLEVDDSLATDTMKSVGPLASNTTYYWRVSAANMGGVSAYSAVRKFTTGAVTSLRAGEFTFRVLTSGNAHSLHFSLSEPTYVSVDWLDSKGRRVTIVAKTKYEPGNHTLAMPAHRTPGIVDFRAGKARRVLKVHP